MTENYIVNLVAWIILYASFWLTKHSPVSTAFRRRECHTGFLAKWLEKTIFPFRWYGSRPTYEYAIGLLLLCCILFTVSLHISVAHFDLPQIYFDTVYEHCRFTFISGICAVCGYYCLIVDVSRIEKVLYIRTLSGEHLSGLMEQRRDLFCCSIRTAWRDTWKELHAEANLYHQRGGAARAERDKGLPINNAPVDRLHICRR